MVEICCSLAKYFLWNISFSWFAIMEVFLVARLSNKEGGEKEFFITGMGLHI